jgi:branched-chain amino acid transport system substrate-binding protein
MVQPPPDHRHPQNVAVVLRIGAGNFASRFSVVLQILEEGQLIQEHHDLSPLPAAADMLKLYQEWQDRSVENSRKLQAATSRKIQAVPAQKTNVADLEDWRQKTQILEDYCRRWFQEQAFRSLRDRIQANVKFRTDQAVPILVSCDTGDKPQDAVLRRLPWHLWDLFISRHNTEFALLTRFHHQANTLTLPIRVLAIFGSSQGGLQLEKDAAALQILQQRGAHITQLVEPDPEELPSLLRDQAWDILFFAGHSSSEGTSGRIQIREDVSLRLDDLRQSLTKAVAKGLKLAIFNSCDGLGIADFLAELHVPVMIVMRQPVPDQIACQFLLDFLDEFSQGKPLCLAVREARDRLEAFQNRFPGASWLPTVCQNPNQPQLVWQQRSRIARLISRLNPLSAYLIIGSVALAGAIAIATPIVVNRCQIFTSICDNSSSAQKFVSDGHQAIAGSKVKLSQPYDSLKRQGIAAFSKGKYGESVTILNSLRSQAKQNKSNPDLEISKAAIIALQDPESLIFRNNAFINAQRTQNSALPIYTIAVAAPLNLDAGMGIVFGVAQAQDIAIQQGINLQVVIANDNNKPEQAQQVAKLLSDDARVMAVVGHYTSPNTCTALKIYSPNQLVVITPTSTAVNLQSNPTCGSDPNRIFFRTVSTSRVEASSLVQYLVSDLNKPHPNVVVFYNRNELFSRDLFDQFVQVLNAFEGRIVATFDLSDPNFDTRQLPPQVKEADALVVLPDGGTGGTTAFQNAIDIIKLNNREKPILGANTLYLQDVLEQVGDATVDRLFIAVDWHPKQCGADAFTRQINEYWGGDLNRRTALAYEAVQAVGQAIRLSKSKPSMTRQDIKQKLSETGIRDDARASSEIIKGLSISFDARGDRREITTRAIVTVNPQLRFDLTKDVACPKS